MTDRDTEDQVAAHYHRVDLRASIERGLSELGKDQGTPSVDDTAPMDEFHVRGRAATEELAQHLEPLGPGVRVLDIGSGLGGTARYLASRYSCQVTGLDLTASYCEIAGELSSRVGLSERTRFLQGSALDLPFDDESFDVVWTEHVQMNIKDKERFYAEAIRVLKPGGHFVFHDIFAGGGGPPAYPMPWSADSITSFLATPADTRERLTWLGLKERVWEDRTIEARAWFEAAMRRNAMNGGPPALGIHLLMGASARDKFGNILAGLRERRIATVQAVWEK